MHLHNIRVLTNEVDRFSQSDIYMLQYYFGIFVESVSKHTRNHFHCSSGLSKIGII